METIWKVFPNPSFTVSLTKVPYPIQDAVDPHYSEEFKLLANFYLLPDKTIRPTALGSLN